MFKFLSLREQMIEERIERKKAQAKIKAITKEKEVITEEGTEVIVEPILKDENNLLLEYVSDVDYRLILQELGIGGM
jgi:phosphoribosyl-ATP pyrophosphohydrolase